jgi:hypothetical protein
MKINRAPLDRTAEGAVPALPIEHLKNTEIVHSRFTQSAGLRPWIRRIRTAITAKTNRI